MRAVYPKRTTYVQKNPEAGALIVKKPTKTPEKKHTPPPGTPKYSEPTLRFPAWKNNTHSGLASGIPPDRGAA